MIPSCERQRVTKGPHWAPGGADCSGPGCPCQTGRAGCRAHQSQPQPPLPACSLIGKAAFHLGEHQQSELAYRKAVEANPAGLPAWRGLAELGTATGSAGGAVEAYQKLVRAPFPAPRPVLPVYLLHCLVVLPAQLPGCAMALMGAACLWSLGVKGQYCTSVALLVVGTLDDCCLAAAILSTARSWSWRRQTRSAGSGRRRWPRG